AEALEPELLGESQSAALNQLELEHDNLRQALAWALRTENYDLALRLGGALRNFWHMHGHYEEGRLWLEEALDVPGASLDVLPPLLVAKAAAGAARLSAALGRSAQAQLYGERALETYRLHGNPADAVYALDTLAWVAQRGGDPDRSALLLEEAIDLARR